MMLLAPGWLALLGVLGLLVAAYVFVQRRRPRYVVRFTALNLLDTVAPDRPGWRRHVPAALVLLALTSLVVGLARPAYEAEARQRDATVVLTVGVSPNLMADDIEPTRFEALVAAVEEFLEELPEHVEVGLVSFAAEAQVEVSPTTDRDELNRAMQALEFRSYTHVGEALTASLQVAETARPPEPADEGENPETRVVLLAGYIPQEEPVVVDAAERVASADIPVDTIAFGTPDGEIVLADGPMAVPVGTEELELIAETTDGEFYEAGSAEAIREVYSDIGASVRVEQEPREVTPWLIASALLLTLLAAGFSLRWFARLP